MLLKSSSGCDYLVVGLGNPGSKYWNTRHNVGFAALDALADDLGAKVDRVKFQGLTGQASLNGLKLVLLKPTTYMNLSGQSVQAAARFYKVPPAHIIVLSDDISLDPGRLRVRKSGSAGGHNGLKSIIASTGSQDFPRIKIGVGAKPHPDYDLADWVLGVIPHDQRELMEKTYQRAAEAVKVLILQGPEAAANQFNGK
ncbi:MAG: aminoacyl-tRNA hydrolase [Oscillospiraceae bacterium]|nr:aminoacyl-tRNA hydrolase [Oscillospiraceae bacterium]